MNNDVVISILTHVGIAGFSLYLFFLLLKAIVGKLVLKDLDSKDSTRLVFIIILVFAVFVVIFSVKDFLEKKQIRELENLKNKSESQIKLNKNSVPFFSTTDMTRDLSDTSVSNKFNNFILENQGEVVKLEVAINTTDTNIKINFSDENKKENPYFVLEDELLEYRYVIERNEELYNVRTSDSGFLYITGYFAVGNQTVPHHKYSLGDGMATIIGLRPIPAEKIIK